ncbi:MAG: glycosyltransferase [Gammaproteobacteria bacterium]|nr:MAG: glycosyltransferase [Gammaproteobacteria bacterium]
MANQTQALCRHLEAEGLRVAVVRTNAPYRPAWIAGWRGVRALARLLPYLVRLWEAAGRAPVMHVMANSGWSWHLMAAPAVWIGSLRGCSVVVNYRGGQAAEFFARQWRWVRPTLARARALAVPSSFLQRVFRQYGREAEILPNLIEPGVERCAPEGGRFLVLVARNLEPIYDVATALEGFARFAARVPEARLAIAGQGPEAGRLRALARRLGIAERVDFLGALPHAELLRHLARADVLLNTSRVDNSPNALLEACALGVPVASTAAGGIPDIVEDGVSALLFPCGDAPAAAAALLRLYQDPALRARLAEQGRRLAEGYRWPAVRRRLFTLYTRASGGRFRPAAEAEGGHLEAGEGAP